MNWSIVQLGIVGGRIFFGKRDAHYYSIKQRYDKLPLGTIGSLQESDDFQNSGTLRRIPTPTLFDHFPQLIGQLLMSGA